MRIYSRSLTASVYKLASCLALLGGLLASKAYAAQTCSILVDSKITLKGDLTKILPGSNVSVYSGLLPESIFTNRAKFNQQQIDETLKIFPNENTYRLTIKNGQHYLVLRSNQVVNQDIRTVGVSVDLPSEKSPLSCTEIKSWQNVLVAKQRYLKLLSDYLLDKPTSNAGEALIDVEALAYINKGKPYPILEIRKKYNDLLNFLKRSGASEEVDPIKSVEKIRHALEAIGIKKYHRDEISFLDFFKPGGGTNCQGQTALFIALFLDLKIKNTDPKKQFGFQNMLDHVRPVFYDGAQVLDALYATSEPDTGDPVFAPKYLLYLALKPHVADLPEDFLKQFDQKDFTQPYNYNKWTYAILKRISPLAPSSQPQSTFEVKPFDFSGVYAVTKFNPNEIPKEAVLSLDGKLDNPTKITKEHRRLRGTKYSNSKMNPNTKQQQLPRGCQEENALLDILSSEEIADLRRAVKQNTIDLNVLNKYLLDCPGTLFARRPPGEKSFFSAINLLKPGRDQIEQILLPDDLINRIDRNLPYAQKIDIIFDYFLEMYIENIEKLTKSLEGTDSNVFLNITSIPNIENSFAVFSRDKIYYNHDRRFYSHPRALAAQAKLIKSYFDLQKRIVHNPEIYLEALNKLYEKDDIYTYSKNLKALIQSALPLFSKMGFATEGDQNQQTLANLVHMPKADLQKEFATPFASTWEQVILSDKIRVALEPMKAEEISQLKYLQNKLNRDSSTISNTPIKEKVELPKFGLNISSESFYEMCKNNPGRYFSSGSMYWQCPDLIKLKEIKSDLQLRAPKLPKEFIVSPTVYEFLFFNILSDDRSPEVVLRLISGLSVNYLNLALEKMYFNRDHLVTILTSFPYLLNAANPTLPYKCSGNLMRGVPVHAETCHFKEMSFNLFNLEDMTPPFWVKDDLSISFWLHAKIKLSKEFADIVEPASMGDIFAAQNTIKVLRPSTLQDNRGLVNVCSSSDDPKIAFQYIKHLSENQLTISVIPCTVVKYNYSYQIVPQPSPAPPKATQYKFINGECRYTGKASVSKVDTTPCAIYDH